MHRYYTESNQISQAMLISKCDWHVVETESWGTACLVSHPGQTPREKCRIHSLFVCIPLAVCNAVNFDSLLQ